MKTRVHYIAFMFNLLLHTVLIGIASCFKIMAYVFNFIAEGISCFWAKLCVFQLKIFS